MSDWNTFQLLGTAAAAIGAFFGLRLILGQRIGSVFSALIFIGLFIGEATYTAITGNSIGSLTQRYIAVPIAEVMGFQVQQLPPSAVQPNQGTGAEVPTTELFWGISVLNDVEFVSTELLDTHDFEIGLFCSARGPLVNLLLYSDPRTPEGRRAYELASEFNPHTGQANVTYRFASGRSVVLPMWRETDGDQGARQLRTRVGQANIAELISLIAEDRGPFTVTVNSTYIPQPVPTSGVGELMRSGSIFRRCL